MAMKIKEKNKRDKMDKKKSFYTYTITQSKDGILEGSITVLDKYGSSVFEKKDSGQKVLFDEEYGGNLFDFLNSLFLRSEKRLNSYLSILKSDRDEDEDEDSKDFVFTFDEEDGNELERRATEKGVDVNTYILMYVIKDRLKDENSVLKGDTFEDRITRRFLITHLNDLLSFHEKQISKDKDKE